MFLSCAFFLRLVVYEEGISRLDIWLLKGYIHLENLGAICRFVRPHNPMPWVACYYGEKPHRQNEKLTDSQTPLFTISSSFTIYGQLYCHTIWFESIWDWFLVQSGVWLFMQNLLQQYRHDKNKPLFAQNFPETKFENLKMVSMSTILRKPYTVNRKSMMNFHWPMKIAVSSPEFARNLCEIGMMRLPIGWYNHRIKSTYIRYLYCSS